VVQAEGAGAPIIAHILSERDFARLIEGAAVPVICFHDLRHAGATRLLDAGVQLKIVSERLGHSTIAITLDIYSYVLPTLQKEAAETLRRFVIGTS
jgi:integrase